MANEQNPLKRNHVEDVVADDNYGVDPAGPRSGNKDSKNNVTVAPVHIPNINDVACFVRQNIFPSEINNNTGFHTAEIRCSQNFGKIVEK